MALLKVYDVTKKQPDDLVSSQNIADVSDAIIIADELVKREPAYLYKVFDLARRFCESLCIKIHLI